MPPSAVLVRRRAGLVVTCIGLSWLILVGRLVQLQIIQRDSLAQRAERQRSFLEDIPARPGDIVDAQGRLLATSVPTRSLFLVPSRIVKPFTYAETLAAALDLPPETLYTRLCNNADKQFLWVQRRLDDDQVQRIRDLKLPAGTWGFRDEYRRIYPQGTVASHVLGIRDIDGQGRGGIEESCDRILRGSPGRRTETRDARGRVIDVIAAADEQPVDGGTVTLTLDTLLQLQTERVLDDLMVEWKPESCCAIVLDPNSGSLLAMASRPTFDPNGASLAAEDAWKNRAIADIYEPGSTFKPLIVAYGVDQGLLQRDERLDCEWGRYRMGRRLLHDHHPYGTLSLVDVLVKSSNIGMAKVGEKLGNEGLFAAAQRFGFGQVTGVELPGELGGILRPFDQWTSYSTGSIPMGHEIATTPLQLITAHAVLANGGLLVRPKILKTDDATDPVGLRGISHRIISEDAARWIVQGPMHEVVTRGTGKKAQLPGWNVFGKTGTAQCLSPKGGYVHGRYISSFLCGAPVEAPKTLVLVVVNQASTGGEAFGGRVAAPAAARILKQALELAPATKVPTVVQRPVDGN